MTDPAVRVPKKINYIYFINQPMRNILLLLILYIGSLHAHAQQIDKKLLIGRWDLYSAKDPGNSLCRDSLDQITERIMRQFPVDTAQGNGSVFSYNDSLELAKTIRNGLNVAFKSYMKFDEQGNMEAFACAGDECFSDTTQYQWIDNNQISKKKATGTGTEVFTILSLTDARLSTRMEDLESGATVEMTFTRAK